MKATITRNEYLQIVGLLTLGYRATRRADQCVDAVGEIVGEDAPRDGHIGDLLWGSNGEPDADALLRKLGVTVAKETPKE